jgi:ribose transport system permease protein
MSMGLLGRLGGAGFAALLLVVLLIVNVWLMPGRFSFEGWRLLIGLAAPLVGAAIASTPPILAGRGASTSPWGPRWVSSMPSWSRCWC